MQADLTSLPLIPPSESPTTRRRRSLLAIPVFRSGSCTSTASVLTGRPGLSSQTHGATAGREVELRAKAQEPWGMDDGQ